MARELSWHRAAARRRVVGALIGLQNPGGKSSKRIIACTIEIVLAISISRTEVVDTQVNVWAYAASRVVSLNLKTRGGLHVDHKDQFVG